MVFNQNKELFAYFHILFQTTLNFCHSLELCQGKSLFSCGTALYIFYLAFNQSISQASFSFD